MYTFGFAIVIIIKNSQPNIQSIWIRDEYPHQLSFSSLSRFECLFFSDLHDIRLQKRNSFRNIGSVVDARADSQKKKKSLLLMCEKCHKRQYFNNDRFVSRKSERKLCHDYLSCPRQGNDDNRCCPPHLPFGIEVVVYGEESGKWKENTSWYSVELVLTVRV